MAKSKLEKIQRINRSHKIAIEENSKRAMKKTFYNAPYSKTIFAMKLHENLYVQLKQSLLKLTNFLSQQQKWY